MLDHWILLDKVILLPHAVLHDIAYIISLCIYSSTYVYLLSIQYKEIYTTVSIYNICHTCVTHYHGFWLIL